ncbi:feline leukemia virus subgroup C receptor-related protein 2-like isoform X1 [Dinothrombium tinctorium]|uniref:Feline leukemia virus subgroup C receptor-related protein 2-like isoform X1 n=1 Tax=Dinothrombium tinctorium TaxID=1965070 RepID=A0A3S3SM47_9ACAR|nr:feline leukemia virus subgroup C receptor-related protein 2-like isoform X1 [Dinothrombium tinctorium]
MEKSCSNSFVTYKRRYLNLLLLCLNLIITYFQQTIYTSIANVTTEYYHVNYIHVNLTGLSWDITSILFYYIFGKFVEKFGLETSMVVSAFINALSASFKCIAVKRNLFWLLLTCQFICAAVNKLFVLSMSVMATTWFKSNEFALAVGICEAAIAIGITISFLFPGLDKPPTPPCLAEQRRANVKRQSIRKLLKNKNFVLLVACIGLVDGIYAAINYTLNQSVLSQFANGNDVVSIAGVINSLSSIPGSIFAGILLKKCSKFKLLHIFYSVFLTFSTALYILSLWLQFALLLYLSSVFLGLSAIGTMVLIYDYVVEVTYPYPESVSFGVLFTFMYAPTLLSAPLITLLIPKYGAVIANSVNLVFGFLSIFLAIFVSEDLRRKKANEEAAQSPEQIIELMEVKN